MGVFQCVLTTFLCWQCMVCGRSGLHGVCAPLPVVGVTVPEPESAHHLSMVVGAVMAQKLRVNSATLPFAQVCTLLFLSLVTDVSVYEKNSYHFPGLLASPVFHYSQIIIIFLNK